MNITYWSNFSKRRNSTKVPNVAGTAVTVNIKEPTSIENPVFILAGNYFNINYVGAWGHYYFVEDIVSVHNGLVEIHCSQDRMASYRTEILASSQLVSRSASNYNGKLIDTMCNKEMAPVTHVDANYATGVFTTDPSEMAMILTIKGDNGSEFFSVKASLFHELGQAIYRKSQHDIWDNNLVRDVEAEYLDPFSYLVDAKIIPIKHDLLSGTSTSTIKLGYWDYTDPDGVAIFKALSDRVVYRTSDPFTVSPTTYATNENEFLNGNEFRELKLNLPGGIQYPIDCDKMVAGSSINIDCSVDCAGGIAYRITYASIVDYITGVIGIPVAVHSNMVNYAGMVSGITGVVSGAVAGGGFGAMFGPMGSVAGAVVGAGRGLISGIGNGNTLGQTRSVGADGSIASFAENPNIQLIRCQYSISGRSAQRNGYPCMKYLQLSTLSGYAQCMNASVDMTGFGNDKEAVEAMLNEGFYVE